MNILICDDSKIARKSILRHIEIGSDTNVFQAENGREGVQYLSEHPIDIVFLDLTMPIMDGFELLSLLPVNTHPTKIIVVSGDIQAEAKNRCLQLGADAFLDKPFTTHDIEPLFEQYGIEHYSKKLQQPQRGITSDNLFAYIREISNIALGASASLISEQVGRFIDMPIPTVATLHKSELRMTLQDIVDQTRSCAVSQRFVGFGISGEALVCMNGSRLDSISDSESPNEEILDLANLLISTFLSSFSQQLDIMISLRQPMVLEKDYVRRAITCEQFLESYEQEIFTIEFVYASHEKDLTCEVIFLMDKDSLKAITRILETIL